MARALRSHEGRLIIKGILNEVIHDYMEEHPEVSREEVITRMKLAL